jgi:hypothetical protein
MKNHERFIWIWSREVGLQANINNQPKSLSYTWMKIFNSEKV